MACRLQELGFERGWGDTGERVLEMMHLLSDILQAPDPSTLETFLGRMPMVFNVVILSVHGYFGQANVLGLPDTGGQVIVIHKELFLFGDGKNKPQFPFHLVGYVDCLYPGSSSCLGE